MKRRIAALILTIASAAALCGCGRMSNDRIQRPEETVPSVPPVEMPDVNDGFVDDRDGVIEDSSGIKDNDRTQPSTPAPEL